MQRPTSVVKRCRALTSTSICIFLLIVSSSTSAQNTGAAYSLGNTMNPQVMTGMMNQMMSNPFAMMQMNRCGQCHDGNDLARYHQTVMPMMAMMNPSNWFNPMAYQTMMNTMMNPQTYQLMFEGMTKKYMPTNETASSTEAETEPTE